jgi:hypothetical protein
VKEPTFAVLARIGALRLLAQPADHCRSPVLSTSPGCGHSGAEAVVPRQGAAAALFVLVRVLLNRNRWRPCRCDQIDRLSLRLLCASSRDFARDCHPASFRGKLMASQHAHFFDMRVQIRTSRSSLDWPSNRALPQHDGDFACNIS